MVKESLNCLRGIIKESLDPKSQHVRSYNKARVDLLYVGMVASVQGTALSGASLWRQRFQGPSTGGSSQRQQKYK